MAPTDLTVGVVVERRGRFLMIEERVAGALVITQPGGHIETGESPEAAARREALEESGCTVDVGELLGVYLWVQPESGQQFLRIVFAADFVEQQLDHTLDKGIVAVHWLSRAELETRRDSCRTPVVLRCIEDYETGRRPSSSLLRDYGSIHQHVPDMLANASVV